MRSSIAFKIKPLGPFLPLSNSRAWFWQLWTDSFFFAINPICHSFPLPFKSNSYFLFSFCSHICNLKIHAHQGAPSDMLALPKQAKAVLVNLSVHTSLSKLILLQNMKKRKTFLSHSHRLCPGRVGTLTLGLCSDLDNETKLPYTGICVYSTLMWKRK